MDIADRMKGNYEDRQQYWLTRRTPVIVRVDGKSFHSYTRGMDRPFDQSLVNAMVIAAERVASQMQGFKLGYLQSDEASFLLTDFDTLTTEAWFGYKKSKVESVAASMMTAYFNDAIGRAGRIAMFDGRAFNIPREEVANYFLWRAKDWERNSVSMYCRSCFSAKQMNGQGRADQHEMLHTVGKNWATDLPDQLRNGTFFRRGEYGFDEQHDVLPTYEGISSLVEPAFDSPPAP